MGGPIANPTSSDAIFFFFITRASEGEFIKPAGSFKFISGDGPLFYAVNIFRGDFIFP